MQYYSNNNSLDARNEKYNKGVETAQKTSEEAMEHGRRALNGLAAQGEILQQTEDTVEANEYTLDKSMKILRGMTWSGMFYNAFNSDPERKDVQGNQAPSQSVVSSTVPGTTSTTGSSSMGSVFGFDRAGISADKGELLSGTSTAENQPELAGLSRNVDELLNMSHVLGDQIEQQHQTLGRIEDKSSRVHDKTLAVTLRSSQLTERASSASAQLLGTYQFVEAGSAKYLAVVGEDIVWLSQPDRSTFFNCFLKANNIVGIQSDKTLKYLGLTMWGTVRASGAYFGKSEECFVELDGRPTGIALLACNWGGGGWLKQPRQLALQEQLEAEAAAEERQRVATGARRPRTSQEADKAKLVFPLDAVSSSLTDREGTVITVHAVQASAGDLDWCTDRNKDTS